MPAAPRKTSPDPPAGPSRPPWYEAVADLYAGDPESGTMPVRAFAPGDRVPPDLVDANGWAGQVRDPREPAETPPDPPRTAPAAATTGNPASEEQ